MTHPLESHIAERTFRSLGRLSEPSISVVICNFNYARYLREAIASVLGQTRLCEVIVVDDGSTDDSRLVLQAVDPRVVVLLQPNGGQTAAYNSGFARCSGDIVIFLDADDALDADAAETLCARFDAGIAKVHFRMRLVDSSGREVGGSVPTSLADGDVLPSLVRDGMLYPSAPGSGNAYRRAVLTRLFPLPVDASDLVGADFFTIYGAVAFGRVAACDKPLGRYRLHRDAAAAGEDLVFGNAAIGNNEAAKVEQRFARLRALVDRRTAGQVRYPSQFLDFSVLKSSYAIGVLGRPYFGAAFGSGDALRRLLRSVWLQPFYGAKKKVALSAWALLVLIAPRRIGFRLARYVCNPQSRGA